MTKKKLYAWRITALNSLSRRRHDWLSWGGKEKLWQRRVLSWGAESATGTSITSLKKNYKNQWHNGGHTKLFHPEPTVSFELTAEQITEGKKTQREARKKAEEKAKTQAAHAQTAQNAKQPAQLWTPKPLAQLWTPKPLAQQTFLSGRPNADNTAPPGKKKISHKPIPHHRSP